MTPLIIPSASEAQNPSAPLPSWHAPVGDEAEYLYEMPIFHQTWREHLAQRFEILYKGQSLLIQQKTFGKGLLKLREARVSGWNSAWHQSLTTARLAELKDLPQWDYFRVRLQASQDSTLQNDLSKLGYPFVLKSAPGQYSVDLEGGMEGYLKGLSHNSRKSLKKKTRLAQPLNPTLTPVLGAEALADFLEELIHHHLQYWDAKAGGSYLHHEAERDFLCHWVKALQQSGHLVADRLMLDGQTANLSLGVRCGQSFYWLFTVNTGIFNDFAPGIVGLNLRLADCAQQGIRHFHMGPGDYFYKIQSANRVTDCLDLVIANPQSLRGQIYLQLLKAKKQ